MPQGMGTGDGGEGFFFFLGFMSWPLDSLQVEVSIGAGEFKRKPGVHLGSFLESTGF